MKITIKMQDYGYQDFSIDLLVNNQDIESINNILRPLNKILMDYAENKMSKQYNEYCKSKGISLNQR